MLGADNEDIRDTTLAREPWPGAGGSRDTLPLCRAWAVGLGKATVARWSPEGGRTALSLGRLLRLSCHLPVVLRGTAGVFDSAARTGLAGSPRCELPASAATTSHQLGL